MITQSYEYSMSIWHCSYRAKLNTLADSRMKIIFCYIGKYLVWLLNVASGSVLENVVIV